MNTRRILSALLPFLFTLSVQSQVVETSPQVSPTRYDYTDVVRQIVQGCPDKYEQCKAIYRWLCANIAYDTTYSIYTADECWDNRRGVCQAYCELFYRLATPLGIDVRVISGTSKNASDPNGSHAWIFAIVEGESTGILIDPTWGAGSVNGNTFTRSENDMSWFHVDPYWMIFTHFPDDENYQLLPQHITRSQFDALPVVKPVWEEYGFRGRDFFERCIGGDTDLPEMYEEGKGYLKLVEVPLQSTLRIGHTYTFALQLLQDCTPALINKDFYQDWQYDESNGICYMKFVPTIPGTAKLSIKKEGKNYWSVLTYDVPRPTREDLAMLEQHDPLLMPEITSLRDVNIPLLRSYGIDGKQLLTAVRNGKVRSLPTFYTPKGECQLLELPFNGTLRIGETYTFTIRPAFGLKWALINGNDWHTSWETDTDNNCLRQTITLGQEGELTLGVQTRQGGSYSSCVKYKVTL